MDVTVRADEIAVACATVDLMQIESAQWIVEGIAVFCMQTSIEPSPAPGIDYKPYCGA
jgi:hypothetical protein